MPLLNQMLQQTGRPTPPQLQQQAGQRHLGGPLSGNLGPQQPIPTPQPSAGIQPQQQTAQFDFEQNPEDQQSAIDALGFAAQLKEMTEGERKRAWPNMAQALIQGNPKLKGQLDPKNPPDEKTIDAYLKPTLEKQMQLAETDEQRDLIGSMFGDTTEKMKSGIPLKGPVATEIQKKVVSGITDISDLEELYTNFDADAFTYQGKMEEFFAEQLDKLNVSTHEQQQLLKGRIQQRQRIDRMMLIWRKYITGVAGGEKEMKAIEATTLNKNLSPAQAKGALDLLYRRVIRDRSVHITLLKQGITHELVGEKTYTELFEAERKKVTAAQDEYIKKFKEANKGANPNASDLDALRFQMLKESRGKGNK